MKRREFIKLACVAPAAAVFVPNVFAQEQGVSRWRTFRLSYRVELPREGSPARLWLPLPGDAGTAYQMALGSAWSGNADKAAFTRDSRSGTPMFYAEWQGAGIRNVEVVSYVKTADRAVEALHRPLRAGRLPADVLPFLQATPHMPDLSITRATALEITGKAKTGLAKARAIYDWVVDNTFRDPKVQACGVGDIRQMLESGNLGGKCADISSLFVGLCRAAGIPAREVFGIRVADSALFKSLGRSGDVSRAQHCRAEFYLAGIGWVPVDPADVRKAVLEEKLELADPKIAALREKQFGNWEMNWVAFNHGRDIALNPEAAAGRMNFFMYPYAEIGGVARDGTKPDEFAYRITAEELAG